MHFHEPKKLGQGQTFTAPEEKKNYVMHNRFPTSALISLDGSENKCSPPNLDKTPSFLQHVESTGSELCTRQILPTSL